MTSRLIARRSLFAAASLLAGSRALAEGAAAMPRVTIQTDKGLIVVELAAERSPITAAKFLRYVDTGRFDGSTFYRASRSAGTPTRGLIEGGLQNDPARQLPPIAHESAATTGPYSTVGRDDDPELWQCPAPKQENQCKACDACWTSANVNYHQH